MSAGQVLARLDDSVARAALGIAEAQVTAARSELGEIEVRLREARTNQARHRRLVEAGAVAAAELDGIDATIEALVAKLAAASSAVGVAEQQVSLRRVELADTTLRAPFDVEVDVNEAHIGRVFSKQPVAVVLDAYAENRIPGHVVATVPAADRQKATVQVRIAVEQLDTRMLPDMTVKVSFLQETGQQPTTLDMPARLLVPRGAVRADNEGDIVFVVRDGQAERRPVRLGTTEGDRVEIRSGLSAGDRIVIEGPDSLTDKTQVQEASVR